jgi:hypothetical protein
MVVWLMEVVKLLLVIGSGWVSDNSNYVTFGRDEISSLK